jgi:hypothetical protein
MRFCDFDILRTESDGLTTYWVEAAIDLETARDRIEHLSSLRPGQYIVFSQKLQRVVMTVCSTAAA